MLVRRHKRRIEIEQKVLRVERSSGNLPTPSAERATEAVVAPALSEQVATDQSKELKSGKVL